MASRTDRFPVLVAAAALVSHLPSTGHAEPTHAVGRSEYRAPHAAVVPSIDGVADEAAWDTALAAGKVIGPMVAYCDNDGSEFRENFVGSEAVPSGEKDRGWIDAGLFGKLVLEAPR